MATEAADAARSAVGEHCPAGVDAEVVEYLAEHAASLVDDSDGDEEALRSGLEDAAGPLLEDSGVTPDAIAAFCDEVLAAARRAQPGGGASGSRAAARPSPAQETGVPRDADCLLRVENMLLMYGGSVQPLLKNATLELVRGHRYGVVGTNGSGKTTLMSRLASRDIAGFPQSVRVVHLRHEAILRGVPKRATAREYAQLKNAGPTAATDAELAAALADVGFDNEELLDKSVWALSGGWQMRLALACAVAQRANLLLLDEPTNHLDTEAVAWLEAFVLRSCVGGEGGGTAMIVSHDAAFLNRVCTDIVHFTSEAKLVYHGGNFESFKANVLKGDEAKAKEVLEVKDCPSDAGAAWADPLLQTVGPGCERLVFPAPGRLPGHDACKAGPKALSLSRVSFQFPAAEQPVLCKVDLSMLSTSRIGIVGKNGAGKSTLLSLMAGRLRPSIGDLWSHDCVRLVYIGQHHESQLGDYLGSTPAEYMQARFRRGFDAEALPPSSAQATLTATQVRRIREVARKQGKRGREIEAVLGRQIAGKDGNDVLYEVRWSGLTPSENTFEKRTRFRTLGVEYMVEEFDSWMANAWGVGPERPLTNREVTMHLEDFGLPEQVTNGRKLAMLSSGQRSKVMLGASFWTRPHIVFLDEPTNYLDSDTVDALTKALRSFRGGYAIVSHCETFISATCEELWTVADGAVTAARGKPLAAAQP